MRLFTYGVAISAFSSLFLSVFSLGGCTSQQRCFVHQDCPVGQRCFSQQCVPGCSADRGCTGDEVCNPTSRSCEAKAECKIGDIRPCYPFQPSTQNKGSCRAGQQACRSNKKWSGCIGAIGPQKEKCNQKDDDCDGRVDENTKGCSCRSAKDCPSARPTCQGGNCVKLCTSHKDCLAGSLCKGGKCETCQEVKLETCNNLDDDCDGQIDNITQRCAVAPGQKCPGTKICKNGIWGTCFENTPQAEICDGEDNDCDGKIDNKSECCVRPDVFLVLDLSNSMNWGLDGTRNGKPTKLDVLKQAITTLMNRFGSKVRFGFMTYATTANKPPPGYTGDICAYQQPILKIPVPVEVGTAENIKSAVATLKAEGCTAMYPALRDAVTYFQSKSIPADKNKFRRRFLALLTDGVPNTGCPGWRNSKDDRSCSKYLVNEIRTLRKLSVGNKFYDVQSYALGVGKLVQTAGGRLSMNPTLLNAIAQTGGTGKYLQANNQDQLIKAFEQIANKAQSHPDACK